MTVRLNTIILDKIFVDFKSILFRDKSTHHGIDVKIYFGGKQFNSKKQDTENFICMLKISKVAENFLPFQ